jgi:hypothetical protein
MKKGTRNLLIVALILILVGSILGFTGYSLGGLASVTLTRNGPVIVDAPVDYIDVSEHWDTLKSVDIDTDILGLRLEEGDGFSLRGSYCPDLMSLEVSVKNGDLTIHSKSWNDSWFGVKFNTSWFGIGGNFREGELVLTYPKGTKFQTVSIDSDLGSLHIADLTTKQLDIALDAGALSGQNITAEVLIADLNLGSCELEALNVTERGEIDMDTGSLTLDDSVMNNSNIEMDLGSVDYTGALKGVANIRTDMGAIELDLDLAEKELSYDIDSDVGTVRLNGRTLGSSAHSSAEKATLSLNITSDLGSVRIQTN